MSRLNVYTMRVILAALIAAFLLAGCSSDNNDNRHTTATTIVPPPPRQVLRAELRPGPQDPVKLDLDPTDKIGRMTCVIALSSSMVMG